MAQELIFIERPSWSTTAILEYKERSTKSKMVYIFSGNLQIGEQIEEFTLRDQQDIPDIFNSLLECRKDVWNELFHASPWTHYVTCLFLGAGRIRGRGYSRAVWKRHHHQTPSSQVFVEGRYILSWAVWVPFFIHYFILY